MAVAFEEHSSPVHPQDAMFQKATHREVLHLVHAMTQNLEQQKQA